MLLVGSPYTFLVRSKTKCKCILIKLQQIHKWELILKEPQVLHNIKYFSNVADVIGHFFWQQYLKRATRALHRGVKKASSMQARQRSLEAAVFRLSNESRQSDKSCSETDKFQHKTNVISKCWGVVNSSIDYSPHLLQRESPWRWPSSALSALSPPAPGREPPPAPAGEAARNEARSASRGFRCIPGVEPSPTGSKTAPGPQMNFPGPPESDTPPLSPYRRCH